jgi:predicted adenine nucleotide alpha hydrolase (AANH) superfamily ATPase
MKVALHICCAVCAAGAAEKLQQEGHEVLGFFFNPNIHPQEEYQRRLESARRVAQELGFRLIGGAYLPEEWNAAVRSLEKEPEGGKRCPVCFRMRLAKTFEFMAENDCQAFTTTLTMGANKSGQLMGRLGLGIGGGKFLQYDFKKKEGFKRASQLANQWSLYRQHYCGCKYSQTGPISLDRVGSP